MGPFVYLRRFGLFCDHLDLSTLNSWIIERKEPSNKARGHAMIQADFIPKNRTKSAVCRLNRKARGPEPENILHTFTAAIFLEERRFGQVQPHFHT